MPWSAFRKEASCTVQDDQWMSGKLLSSFSYDQDEKLSGQILWICHLSALVPQLGLAVWKMNSTQFSRTLTTQFLSIKFSYVMCMCINYTTKRPHCLMSTLAYFRPDLSLCALPRHWTKIETKLPLSLLGVLFLFNWSWELTPSKGVRMGWGRVVKGVCLAHCFQCSVQT